MTKQIASMREFLRTGALGFLTTDATLLDVARTLGAPSRFLTEHSENIPTYWCYGKLEIQFDCDAPHRTDWFQIEDALYLEGDFEFITRDLVLALEGITGTTRPSTLLRSGIWELDNTVVTIGALADDVTLDIRSGKIRVVYRVDSTFVPDGDALRYVSQRALNEIIREIDDRSAEIDSIFSLRSDKDTLTAVASLNAHAITGSQYLDAI